MTAPHDLAATAALAVGGSLLRALKDHRILPEAEIGGFLEEAAAAHGDAPPGGRQALHAGVAEVIDGNLAGRSPVRRPWAIRPRAGPDGGRGAAGSADQSPEPPEIPRNA